MKAGKLWKLSHFLTCTVCRSRGHRTACPPVPTMNGALLINDAYDIQDLLNPLLRRHFDDVRAEKPTPSFGGSGSRTDFLLKNEQIVVEAKMTRTMAATKEVCFELMEDAAHYWRHSDCKKLVCLVYDPPGLIKDPRGVERYGRSLSSESLDVEVIVVPKD